MVISQSKRAEMYNCGCLNDTNVEAIRSPKHTHEQTNKNGRRQSQEAALYGQKFSRDKIFLVLPKTEVKS